jgi:DNA polymerase-1
MAKMFLIDGSNHAFRMFFALPPMHAPSGEPTSALYGLTTMCAKMLSVYKPDYVAFSFDIGKTFRHDMYPDYKGHRPSMPEDLRTQWGLLPELIEGFGYKVISKEGFEADDVIGTLAVRHGSDDCQVFILTSDKDFGQVVNENIHILDISKGVEMGPDEIEGKMGVRPEQVNDLLGLMGDSSDNIPGVAGIGMKTAAKYLAKYGTLESVLEAANNGEIKGKRGQSLIDEAEAARLSRTLAKICLEVPIDESLDDLAPRGLQESELRPLFDKYGFGRVAARLLPEQEQEAREVVIVQNASALKSLATAMRAASMSSVGLVLDGVAPESASVVGVRIATSPSSLYYVPVREGDENVLGTKAAWKGLKPLFEDPDVLMIGHGLKLDFAVLRRLGITLRGVVGDTRVLHYLLFAHERSHALQEVAMRFLARRLPSSSKVLRDKRLDLAEASLDSVAATAGADAGAILELHTRLIGELSGACETLYRDIEIPLIGVLANMELKGIRLDLEQLEKVRVDVEARLGQAVASCHEYAGHVFNVNSRHELRTVLFDELGLPPSKKVSDGWSTDHGVLERLIGLHPLPKALLEQRTLKKLLSTYLTKLPLTVGDDGRVHTTLWQTVTATGRLSSSDPNLQNIPVRTFEGKRIRACFKPKRGYRFLSADYSQVELRILAHMSGEQTLINAFVNGEDIHRRTASEIFGLPIDWVTVDQRTAAKSINFGLLYGMSAFRLANELGISNKEAQQYMETYFARLPSVEAWITQSKESAATNGYVETMFGRRRLLPTINSNKRSDRSSAEREAVNTRVQGTAADIIKRAMVSIQSTLEASSLRVDLLLQVHDELVLEVHKDDEAAVGEIVVSAMEGAATLCVPLEVVIASGANWADAHG